MLCTAVAIRLQFLVRRWIWHPTTHPRRRSATWRRRWWRWWNTTSQSIHGCGTQTHRYGTGMVGGRGHHIGWRRRYGTSAGTSRHTRTTGRGHFSRRGWRPFDRQADHIFTPNQYQPQCALVSAFFQNGTPAAGTFLDGAKFFRFRQNQIQVLVES